MTYLKAAVDGLEFILMLVAEVDVIDGKTDRTHGKWKSLDLKINERATTQIKFIIYEYPIIIVHQTDYNKHQFIITLKYNRNQIDLFYESLEMMLETLTKSLVDSPDCGTTSSIAAADL